MKPKILQDTEMKTDIWATGEDPDDDDIVVEDVQPGLTPAEQVLDAMKKSEELELQASQLEEKAKRVSFGEKLFSFSRALQQPLNQRLLQS